MSSTINIDWLLQIAGSLMKEGGASVSHADLIARIDDWFAKSKPGSVLYHPYISDAGERGPFVNASARAGFTGLSMRHGFADLLRAVVEGLGMATRDCYAAMGDMPAELRITGGAARSRALRSCLSAAVNAPVRVSQQQEAGAAGAAMMAAVAIGAYDNMDECIAQWVTPHLGEAEAPDARQAERFDRLFSAYVMVRQAVAPAWDRLIETQ